MRIPFLIASIALLFQAVPQSNTPPSTNHANRARQAIEAEIRDSGKAPEQFRIEILGDPDLVLDHTRFHRLAEPPPGRARFSGRMLTAVWEAAGGIRLSLIPSGNPAGAVSVVTSADGEFQFPDVVPGNYQMQFEGSPEFNRNVTLEEGRRRVLVPLGGSEMYSLFSGEDLPERVPAFAAVYQGAELKMLYSIEIRRSSVSVSAMDPTESTEFGLPSLLTDAEWKQVRSQATALIDVLLDVTRGPERFAPFLSSRVVCRIYYSGERRIPSIDDRRCAMYFLDSLALSLWLQAERTGGFRGLPGLDWYDEPTGAPDEVRVALTLRRHEVLREEFRRAGMFEPEHLARMQQYFRAVLIVPPAKFSITRPSRELPLPSGDMYMLPLPMFLIREGQQLRVVGAFQGGG